MHLAPIHLANVVGPLASALAFVAIMSRVREPARRNLNALLIAGAAGAYLGSGLGAWELAYPIVALPVAYLGLRSHRFIGLAWLMHACWDVVHHLHGDAIWPFAPTSSLGCTIFDSAIAVWFVWGAPSMFATARARTGARPEIA